MSNQGFTTGRPTSQAQVFFVGGAFAWNNPYRVTRTYGLAGNLKTQTYPSGHTVTYVYDDASRLNSFTGNLGDGTQRNYSTSISYSEWGPLKQEQFGTQTALYRNLHYNVRGQLFDMRVGSGMDNSPEWTWNRGCLQWLYTQQNNTFGGSGTDNSGNPTHSYHYIPGNDQSSSWTLNRQDFTYDSLNRLTLVQEADTTNTGGGGVHLSQGFSYDRYGNRTINQAATWGTGVNNRQFSVDTATNRLGVPSGQSGTMSYDAAGNLTFDNYTGTGLRTYDAENQMTDAADTSNTVSTHYKYDADGRRVKRTSFNVETWQIYGIDGELVAEYGANASAANPQKEYGFRNGELLITATGSSNNLALYKNATQSSTYPGSTAYASRAVDGNTDGDYYHGSVSHTDYGTNPWWQVDIGSSASIQSIKVWNRTDGSAARLTDFYVFVSNQPFTSTDLNTTLNQSGVWNYHVTGQAGSPTQIPVNGTGRYVRVQLNGTNFLHMAEVEVLAPTALPSDVEWLATDQLGTPRMVIDRTGSLAGVKRHDYLPFGEELFGGGRTTTLGYSQSGGVRQKFTGYERDGETDLEYAQARYYSHTQGRFASVDPENLGANPPDPQSWNGYAYARSNPVLYTDPDGRDYLVCNPDRTQCGLVSDDKFYKDRSNLEGIGLNFTGSRDFFEHGQISDPDGNVLATYVQISIDDPFREFIYQMRIQTAPIPKAVTLFFGISAVTGATGGVVFYALSPATITTLGLSGAPPAADSIPDYARRVLNYIQSSNGSPPQGYKGGQKFLNDGRGGGQVLPKVDGNGKAITYREYDVNTYQKGVNRGTERIVRGSDGSAYYTDTHYRKFTQIR